MEKPSSPQCLGLVGGLGPAATVHYYSKIVDAFAQRNETPRLVMSHADTSFALECVQTKAIEKLADYLAGHIRRMRDAGATIAAVPAVAPHICAPELKARSVLPLVDMIDSVQASLDARKLKRIALMGIRFVMESAFYGRLKGIEIVPLSPADTEAVHEAYMGIVKSQVISPENVSRLREIAKAMVERQRVDAIALAGTELTVAFDEKSAGFPAFDCATAHLEAIVATMLSKDVSR